MDSFSGTGFTPRHNNNNSYLSADIQLKVLTRTSAPDATDPPPTGTFNTYETNPWPFHHVNAKEDNW